jgi:hypothetical protein
MYLFYNFCTTLRVSNHHSVHHQQCLIFYSAATSKGVPILLTHFLLVLSSVYRQTWLRSFACGFISVGQASTVLVLRVRGWTAVFCPLMLTEFLNRHLHICFIISNEMVQLVLCNKRTLAIVVQVFKGLRCLSDGKSCNIRLTLLHTDICQ